jgi:hypothetical protein
VFDRVRRKFVTGSATRGMAQGLMVLGALAVSACARQVVSTDTNLPGVPAPAVGGAPATAGSASGQGAVESFLAAVNAQDLQAMSALWGNENGLARDRLKRDELEKRLIVMQCLMAHDKHVFLEGQPRMKQGGRREHMVELTKGRISAKTTITTVLGPKSRWLVEDVDVTPLRDFCQ